GIRFSARRLLRHRRRPYRPVCLIETVIPGRGERYVQWFVSIGGIGPGCALRQSRFALLATCEYQASWLQLIKQISPGALLQPGPPACTFEDLFGGLVEQAFPQGGKPGQQFALGPGGESLIRQLLPGSLRPLPAGRSPQRSQPGE